MTTPSQSSDPGRDARLSPRKTKAFVIGFLVIVVLIAGGAAYLIHRARTDEALQQTLREIRERITPPGGSSRDFGQPRDTTAHPPDTLTQRERP